MTESLSPELLARGMTFDEYVAYVGSPANLRRELDTGPRIDRSGYCVTRSSSDG